MRVLKMIVFVVALWVLSLPLSLAPVRGTAEASCDYTGSSESWTTWPLGIWTDYKYHESKIESVIKRKRPGELRHKWVVQRYAPSRNFFNHPIGATTPSPVHSLRQFTLDTGILNVWLEFASDEQIEKLYDVLCGEDPDEIRAKLEEVKKQWRQWCGSRI